MHLPPIKIYTTLKDENGKQVFFIYKTEKEISKHKLSLKKKKGERNKKILAELIAVTKSFHYEDLNKKLERKTMKIFYAGQFHLDRHGRSTIPLHKRESFHSEISYPGKQIKKITI